MTRRALHTQAAMRKAARIAKAENVRTILRPDGSIEIDPTPAKEGDLSPQLTGVALPAPSQSGRWKL